MDRKPGAGFPQPPFRKKARVLTDIIEEGAEGQLEAVHLAARLFLVTSVDAGNGNDSFFPSEGSLSN